MLDGSFRTAPGHAQGTLCCTFLDALKAGYDPRREDSLMLEGSFDRSAQSQPRTLDKAEVSG